MSYENAPATILLATHCAVCARPLVDAISVDTGIGPECRKKYGFNAEAAPEARKEANKIVHDIALMRSRGERGLNVRVAKAAVRLCEIGFNRLADVLVERTVAIWITDDGDGRLAVKAPYDEGATAGFRSVPGRRWDGERKVNTFPTASYGRIIAVLARAFPHAVASGPDGLFSVSAEAKAPAAPKPAPAPAPMTEGEALDRETREMIEAEREAARWDYAADVMESSSEWQMAVY